MGEGAATQSEYRYPVWFVPGDGKQHGAIVLVHRQVGSCSQNLALLEYGIKAENPVLAVVDDQNITQAVMGNMNNIAFDSGAVDDGAHQFAA
jgi:hypothetical protein